MKTKKCTMLGGIFILISVFSIILTSGCGKSATVYKKGSKTEENTAVKSFAEDFFVDNNLPYEVLSEVDVQNTSDEYLLYIKGGALYRTHNDYVIVITERKNLNESKELAGKNYSGELYNIFENDNIDVLKCCASGDFAMLCSMSTISDWNIDPVVTAFMKYGVEYSKK